MERNSPHLWDKLWNNTASMEEDIFYVSREEKNIRWQRIERIVQKEFGSFDGLRIIEIGAGIGTNAALMARRGAEITILDYSNEALKRARVFFDSLNLSATFIKQDALSLTTDLLDKYDVSMSFGLAEHFKLSERSKINKVHFDVLRQGGITFISVPNKFNAPYRVFKFIAENIGIWKVGEEYPYSRKELGNICQEIGVTQYSFFGDSLVSSFNYINPLRIIRKVFKAKKRLDVSRIKKENGSFLDQFFSYALILYGKK